MPYIIPNPFPSFYTVRNLPAKKEVTFPTLDAVARFILSEVCYPVGWLPHIQPHHFTVETPSGGMLDPLVLIRNSPGYQYYQGTRLPRLRSNRFRYVRYIEGYEFRRTPIPGVGGSGRGRRYKNVRVKQKLALLAQAGWMQQEGEPPLRKKVYSSKRLPSSWDGHVRHTDSCWKTNSKARKSWAK